jgi:hypothetical protein
MNVIFKCVCIIAMTASITTIVSVSEVWNFAKQCRQRYTWDMPNIMRGDKDTGERGFLNGGHDYYQDMIIWAMPTALSGESLEQTGKSGSLIQQIIQKATAGNR